MEVDVIIPYSEEHTSREKLNRAKKSVSNQSVDTNIIVVENNIGPAYGRNRGLEKSENRYVSFLDADDKWKEKKLERQLNKIQETGKGFCISGEKDISDKDFVKRVFLEKIVGFTSSMMIDCKKVDINFDEEIYRREDHLFALQAVKEAGYTSVTDDLVKIEKTDRGLSSAEDISKKLQAHKEFYDKAVKTWPFLNDYEEKFWHRAYHRVGRDYYYAEEYSKSAETLKKSIKQKFTIKTLAAFIISKGLSIK